MPYFHYVRGSRNKVPDRKKRSRSIFNECIKSRLTTLTTLTTYRVVWNLQFAQKMIHDDNLQKKRYVKEITAEFGLSSIFFILMT